MSRISKLKRLILASVSTATLLIVSPNVVSFVAPAAAQINVTISDEFRIALTPYGAWQSVPRWGEVWVPARITRDWQPYTVGNWIYSEDYGWYWISSDEEGEWGWVAFHYGRWINIDSYGWAWVPGNEWGPAWVDWRRSDDYVGWAPLPPDEIIAEYRDEPKFWMFVRMADLIAPHLRNTFLSFTQRQATLQRTVIVNRTMSLTERRFAVNPGIAPAIIAKAARQPVRTFEVMPRVVTGTTSNIKGAIQISADDLRRGGARPGQLIAKASIIKQTANAVQPVQNIPPPQALQHNEVGRLGDTPPLAALGTKEHTSTNTAPTKQSAAPNQQPRQATSPTEGNNQQPANKQAPSTVQAPALSAAPPSQQHQVAPRRDERNQSSDERREQSPASRPPAALAIQPPEVSKQAPAHEERNQGSQERGKGPAPHAQPAPTPLAKAPVAPPSAEPLKTSAPPLHQEEKKGEDNKK